MTEIKSQIGLSLDLDWQDGPILEETFRLLKEYGIRATLFCTHKTKVKIPSNHEVGIHPNFSLPINPLKNMTNLRKIYPNAKGLRSHSLVMSYPIFEAIRDSKMKFTSNYLMDSESGIKPINLLGFTELPIFYMDYTHLANNKKPSFKLSDLRLETPGLKVFDFHPLNIYLNSADFKQYHKCKKTNFKNPELFINKTKPGIRDLFIELLQYLKRNQPDARLSCLMGKK